MKSQDLYQILLSSLDLPESIKDSYMEGLLKKYSVTSEELTIEVLREIVADFLQETILEHDRTNEQDAFVQNQ